MKNGEQSATNANLSFHHKKALEMTQTLPGLIRHALEEGNHQKAARLSGELSAASYFLGIFESQANG